MSSFNKKGKRKSIIKDNKLRMKEVKEILSDIDNVAHELIKSGVNISSDNVLEEAEKHTKRPLGDLEVSLLLSKLKHFEQSLEQRRLRLHENNS